MNDLDKELDHTADWLSEEIGLDRARIRQILARRVEEKSQRLTPEKVRADLVVAESVLIAELTKAIGELGAERALAVCERTDLGLLFLRSTYVGDWSRPDPVLYTAPELTERIVVLKRHLTGNREHLVATGYPIVMPSEAYGLFQSPWWHSLGVLYPTAIPVRQSGWLDSSKTPHYSYSWSKRPQERLLTADENRAARAMLSRPVTESDEICEYESASPMVGMGPETARRLEVLRGKVLELELRILEALASSILDGNEGQIWPRCSSLLRGKEMPEEHRLSAHEIDLLLQVDRFYAGDEPDWPPHSDMKGPICVGVFGQILGLILFSEWEVTGKNNLRVREALESGGLLETKPMCPPRISIHSPYQIAGTPAEAALDRAIGLRTAANEAAAQFVKAYLERFRTLLERETPVLVETSVWVPRHAEKEVRGHLEFYAEAQIACINQLGQALPPTLAIPSQQLDVKRTRKDRLHWPFPIPVETKWEHIFISFHGDSKVRIQLSGRERIVAYSEMGLGDGRHGKPNAQWTLLQLFASKQQITWKTKEANRRLKDKKRLLSRALRAYFPGIEGDPFLLIDRKKGWKPRFQLRP